MSLNKGIPTKESLEKLFKNKKLTLTDDQFCELIEVMTIYASKFEDPPRAINEPAQLTKDWTGYQKPVAAETLARRAVVEHVQEIWREMAPMNSGYNYNTKGEIHEGDLISLLFELFKLTTSGDRFPQQATLFHDLNFINTGIERSH